MRELSDRQRAEGKFSIDLFAWDDLQPGGTRVDLAGEGALGLASFDGSFLGFEPSELPFNPRHHVSHPDIDEQFA